MDVDPDPYRSGGELKIKGQAEAERRKSKWDMVGYEEVWISLLSFCKYVTCAHRVPAGLTWVKERRT
jgi:hypothetical protein